MPTPLTNGRVSRKTLADSIDRLDDILDGLSDALNGAVADAVKAAVTAAVREVLSHPDLLRAALARHAPPEPVKPVKPAPQANDSWLGWAGDAAGAGIGWTVTALTNGWQSCWNQIREAGGWVATHPDQVAAGGLGLFGVVLAAAGYPGLAVALCGTAAAVWITSQLSEYLLALGRA